MLDLLKFIIFTLIVRLASGNDWTQCPQECKCKWVSGKKTADCTNADINSIPDYLSSEIQSLDLSGNQINHLQSEAFKSVGLVNLHKIKLQNCKIKEVDKDAFKDLGILADLDLSYNRIHILHPGTFKENVRLRILFVNRNPIREIGAHLFANLSFLQTIDMADCQLSKIDNNAFYNVSNLFNLKFNGNKLVHIRLSALIRLTKLRSLILHDNPWRCDCKLRDFRNWVLDRSLYALPTSCAQPENLRNKNWNIIKPEEFACKPTILWPRKNITINVESRNISLGCKVTGDPMPKVQWLHNSRPVQENNPVKYSVNRYNVKENDLSNNDRWVNVTVIQVDFRDRGQFQCVASNPGGSDDRNITFVVDPDDDGFIGVGNNNDSWPLIIGLITGLIALFIILSILSYWFCCRHKQSQSKKSSVNNIPSNGDPIMHHITNSNEQEKSLLTVNPVQKPPRRYETQSISNNDSIENSELNRKLLDENSLQGNACAGEEDQSIECLDTRQEQPVEKPASEAHPPDLLAFPPRSHNISPASSSTSNGFDNLSRTSLYPAAQQAMMTPNLHYNFGTLPYSRSHSPFSPSAPVVLPRQGYVTIPRRPRIPSWSSAPTPSLLDDPLSPIKNEPVYDNLGPRTTADGSSALSLNKSFAENPRNRMNTSNIPNYFHFDGGKRPSVSHPEKDIRKDGILKRTCSAEGDIGPIRSKVPPKPPPKPKKDGPLFEDEGEDGTEV